VNATERWIRYLIEGRGRKVEIPLLAPSASVNNLDSDRVTAVMGRSVATADWVVIRVRARTWPAVEQKIGNSRNIVGVRVRPAACTETGGVVSSITTVGPTAAATATAPTRR